MENEAVQISVNELLLYVDQIILLRGESSSLITYHRRLNVFGCIINSQYQVKTMLKEKAALLQKHDNELSERKTGVTLLTQSNQREKQRKSSQILKSPFHWAPHIHRDGVLGKMFFSPKAQDWITKSSIMQFVDFKPLSYYFKKQQNLT